MQLFASKAGCAGHSLAQRRGIAATLLRMRARLDLIRPILDASLPLVHALLRQLMVWEKAIGATMQGQPAWAWSELNLLGDRVESMSSGLQTLSSVVRQVLVEAQELLGPLMFDLDRTLQGELQIDALAALIKDAVFLLSEIEQLDLAAEELDKWQRRRAHALASPPAASVA